MNNKKLRILCASAWWVLLLLNGCSVYSPAIQSPVITEKQGQIQIDGNASVSSELLFPPGAHGSLAYGITDNTSLQLSANMKLFHYTEIGISIGNYFINESKFRLGFFPGYSYGEVDYTDMNGDIMTGASHEDYWSGNYQNIYINLQSLFNLKIITLGVGAKTGLYFPDLMNNNRIENKKAIITQPTLYIKPNLKYDRFICALTVSYLSLNTVDGFRNYNDMHNYFYNPFTIAFGFGFKFDTL